MKSIAATDEFSVSEAESSVSYFDVAFIILIIVNLGLVASSHVMQSNAFNTLQINTDIVMNVLYSCELLTRLTAYNSLFLYVTNNPFDFCVVILSDIFLIIDSVSDTSLPGINIFRVARLIRAVKVLYRIPRIYMLLRRMFAALNVAILPCSMLLFWVFCFALVGIQLFKNNGVVSSRLGFESFDVSYITAFSVMTFEKWLDVLDGLLSQNQAVAILYFIVFISVGKYLGLYAIAASVLMTFSLDDVEKYKFQKKQYDAKVEDAQKSKKRKSSTMRRRSSAGAGMSAAAISKLRASISQHDNSDSPRNINSEDVNKRLSFGNVAHHRDAIGSLGSNIGLSDSTLVDMKSIKGKSLVGDTSRVGNVLGLPFVKKADASLQSSFCNAKDDVLFCLNPESSLRGLAVSIISSSAFSATILCSILASIVLLLSPTPFKENPITSSINRTADYVFQGIFVAEFVLKVISSGFYGHLGYWKSYWNRLDLFIIVVGALDLIISALVSDVQVLRFVRVFRMIRPLRLLNRFETLQVIYLYLFFSHARCYLVVFTRVA